MTAAAVTTPDVTIVVADPIRTPAESLDMGFNVPWSAIQGVPSREGSGIWDSSTWSIDEAVLDELRAMPGLTYRYPGGNPSNHFKWMQTVGDMSVRKPQLDPDTGAGLLPVEFGFDEFMAMVDEVDGEATITVNMGDFAANAAAWVEYANAPNDGSNSNGGMDWAAQRAANGHPEPYGIKRWELDNERDLLSHGGWTVETYITKSQEFITRMLTADPTIEIVAHVRTAPWDKPGVWDQWHEAIIAQLGDQIDGLAYHPYYDGLPIPTVQSYAQQIYDDAVAAGHPELKLDLTEHAVWPQNVGDRTTWPATTSLAGAISTADMLVASEQQPAIGSALWHSLGGLGPWQAYSQVDPGTGDYNFVFNTRPLAEALAMLNNARLGDQTVLETTVTGPNASGYVGGYDVSASAALSADGDELTIVSVNRGPQHAAALDLQDLDVASIESTVTLLDVTSGDEPAQRSTSTVTNDVDAAGNLVVALPARSVTVHRIQVTEDTEGPVVTLQSPAAGGPLQSLSAVIAATDNAALKDVTASVYQGSTLVTTTSSTANGAASATHSAAPALADGAYSLRYRATDLAGNVSAEREFAFSIDGTAPTVTVKSGPGETVGSNGTYSLVSFKLYDAGRIDKAVLNGVVKDLTDNTWSDVNYVKPGVFGATQGLNTLVVHDVAGNTTTVTFTLP